MTVSDTPDDPTGAERAKETSTGAPVEAPSKGSHGKDAPPKASGKSGKRASLRSPNDALQPEAAPPPPEETKKKKRRDSLSGTLSGILSFVVVLGLLALGVVAFGIRLYGAPGPLTADKIVLVTPGSGGGDILDQLEREGVVSDATILRGAVYARNLQARVRAGEYLFKANASPRAVLDTLISGRSIQHALTIPEGLTSEQIVQRVNENEVLIGDVREIPKEGLLAPDTYKFGRGMTREKFLAQMRDRQTRLLEDIWQKRAPGLPVKSSYELLTLASIIEKETGKADERPRVASVFVNRLTKGMRLQSDPTIVYGLVGGKGSLGRGITRSEIAKPTVYNTYVISGLPPGPIANPGRASLEAAANPMKTNDLYFVADGTGGHVFASSLTDHNRNVQKWRAIEREAADRAVDDVDPAEAPAADPAQPATQPAPGARPRRRGALEGTTFGALPSRLGAGDAAHAAVIGGPDLARAAAAALGPRRAASVDSARDWAGRMALAFAAPEPPAQSSAGARAIAAVAPARPASAPDASADIAAPAPDPTAPAPASPYAFSSVADSFQIVGVNVTEGGMDLQPDPDQGAPAATGPMVTFPVSSARQADLRARARRRRRAGAADHGRAGAGARSGDARRAPACARRRRLRRHAARSVARRQLGSQLSQSHTGSARAALSRARTAPTENRDTPHRIAMTAKFDLADLKRRMQASVASLKHELNGLRTGRASPSLLEPVRVEAYGQSMNLTQVATISVPEPRALAVQVWDKQMVGAVDRAIRDANLGLSPTVEGQMLRIRIPELNEQRRKEMVKVAHKYAEESRVAIRHVRRDGMDILKKLLKDHGLSEDDERRHLSEVQKATDEAIHEADALLASKEKEIMQV